jgi:anaerobic ribonucleoside-triphosphate reductase activating protein
LRCGDCWNWSSHPFDQNLDQRIETVGNWVLACPGVEGVTFSGGEPFQQAPELLALCEYLKTRRASLSLGVFTGYTLDELADGRWHWKSTCDGDWRKGVPRVFEEIRKFLDFGVFGRFRKTMICHDKPLCSSRNQELVLLSNRYSLEDFETSATEVTIDESGLTQITGFPILGSPVLG